MEFEELDRIGFSDSCPYIKEPEGFRYFMTLTGKVFPDLEKFFNGFQGVEGWRNNSVAFFDEYFYFFLLAVSLYPPVIYGLYQFMRHREAFDLRTMLICWNWFMAAFSFVGSFYLVPIFPIGLQLGGWWGSVCTRWCYAYNAGSFLCFLFDASKILEFVDTLFLVLRKRELIFLHYYHHVVTMLFCWFCNQTSQEYGCHGYYFATMNYVVHFVMYSYFALIAMRIRLPRFFSTFITSIQILQMVVGLLIVITHYTCIIYDPTTFYLGLTLYLSFFYLFVDFFYTKYFSSPPRKTKKE
mmetsp:Transcript_19657/g.27101  ORF Transcript_19657/g.27101 Transcript_19657/m.27101 type:complete len:297 (-) Transcript_19657:28-918(-)